MLVLCALALVAAAFLYLVLGLAGGDVGDLYLSMVLCLGSLVVLFVSARVSRSQVAPAGDQPEPVAAAGEEEAERARTEERRARAAARELATTGAGSRARPGDGALPAHLADEDADDAPAVADRVDGLADPPADADAALLVWAAGGEAEAVGEEPAEAPPVGDHAAGPLPDGFPIADYDDLRAGQVLALVPELWPEEVPVVAARERATQARPEVLDALAAAVDDPALAFPIAEYPTLAAEQVTALLPQLDGPDLDLVRTAERNGEARVGVLMAVADELASRR